MTTFRILFIIASVIASFAISMPTSAQFDTGNDLLERCHAADATWEQASCFGYVSGVADLEHAPLVIEGRKFCLPDSAARRQLIDVVVKWLEENPNVRHGPAAYAVFFAFVEAFPCS